MAFTLVRLVLILAAISFLDAAFPQAIAAQPISPKNPFRSYNISGVNYGSQQWEKAHRSKATPARRSGRFFSRRR